jgi:transaldolase
MLLGDTGSIDEMQRLYDLGAVAGFTTNPSLLRRSGVTDCMAFAAEVLGRCPGVELSIPVLTDDARLIRREARRISECGPSVFAKVPIVGVDGTSLAPVIAELHKEGVQVNTTAIMTMSHLRALEDAGVTSEPGPPMIWSVLAGRIADSGRDAAAFVRSAAEVTAHLDVRVLWASVREVSAIYAAELAGARYVTASCGILDRLALRGADLDALAVATVREFLDDARAGGLRISA